MKNEETIQSLFTSYENGELTYDEFWKKRYDTSDAMSELNDMRQALYTPLGDLSYELDGFMLIYTYTTWMRGGDISDIIKYAQKSKEEKDFYKKWNKKVPIYKNER